MRTINSHAAIHAKWPETFDIEGVGEGAVIRPRTGSSATVPTQAQINQAEADHTASRASVKYRDDRRAAYASWGDQLDTIWKWLEAEGLVPDTSESRDLNTAAGMLGEVKAVKAAHPKGD
jgi:hypothetical protein